MPSGLEGSAGTGALWENVGWAVLELGCEPDNISVAAPATRPVVPRARIRSCRLPAWSSPSCRCCEGRRGCGFIGLDVHLDFCEIAICEAGRVCSGGRVPTSAQGLAIVA